MGTGRQVFIIFILFTLQISGAYADGTHPRGIITDGTIGSSGCLKLEGPNYEIVSRYGHLSGTNLFHSFEQFNIHSDESATFSGPGSVQNIISRVTGPKPSWIDGKLGSSVPGANLYILNPRGMMFGPNASLDLGGSFHVSTAHYMRFDNNDIFHATISETETFSTAEPAAFGFLDTHNGPVSIKGAALNVSEGKTVSLVGGSIEMENAVIKAPGVQINIAALASPGEVQPSPETGAKVSDFRFQVSKPGKITLSDKSSADVSGNKAGSIYIRGGEFVVSDSSLSARTLGHENGGLIYIETDNLLFKDGAEIDTGTSGQGRGADIMLDISESAVFEGENSQGVATVINSSSNPGTQNISSGEAGNITIKAGELVLKDGARITSSSSDLCRTKSGDIDIEVSGTVRLSGSGPSGENGDDLGTGIYSFSENIEENTGNPGNISLKPGDLVIEDGAVIKSRTSGNAPGKDIQISADDSVNISGGGIHSESQGNDPEAGNSGKIDISAKSLVISDQGIISAASKESGGGRIFINAENMIHLIDGKIKTSVKNSNGHCGDITAASKFIILNCGSITANAQKENGGSVLICSDNFIRSGYSAVKAESVRGIGTAQTEIPDLDITEDPMLLPDNYLAPVRWAKNPCEERAGEKKPPLAVSSERDGIPTSHDDWLPAQPLLFENFSSDSNPHRKGYPDKELLDSEGSH